MHATKPKECGATFLSSSSKIQLARIVHKASLPGRKASDETEIGDDVLVSCRGTRKMSQRQNVHVDVALLHKYWWKGSPVPDVCELRNNVVVHPLDVSGSCKETHQSREVF